MRSHAAHQYACQRTPSHDQHHDQGHGLPLWLCQTSGRHCARAVLGPLHCSGIGNDQAGCIAPVPQEGGEVNPVAIPWLLGNGGCNCGVR